MSGRERPRTDRRFHQKPLAGSSRPSAPVAATECCISARQSFRSIFRRHGAAEQSYLSPGIGPEAMASFFHAAAGLFRAKPWKVVPSDQILFSVTIEKLGVRDAAMSVIGQMGQSLGLVLFSSLNDFEAYLDAADAMKHGEEPKLPPHLAFNFERGADLAPVLRKEVAKHKWEVVDANAYPWLVAIDEDLVARPPTAGEVTMAEAVARALTGVMADKKALRMAWKGGEPISRTLSVETHQGEIEVTLGTPYMRTSVVSYATHDTMADRAAYAAQPPSSKKRAKAKKDKRKAARKARKRNR